MNKNTTHYNPTVFDVSSIQDAKNIILTQEEGMSTDERWKLETPFLAQDIGAYFSSLDENSVIIDYGCGIGRISKELINQFSCKVIGIDISESMRTLSQQYVDSENFEAISPLELKKRLLSGLRVDAAISIWVLQHALDPIADIA
jgi:2-polyprenyl-3-methyl-5-hydroxy-6-metoxy-1,4-benzoquinol methylase